MAKKYYAVKKGRKTGIFDTWTECKTQVSGYSGAVYKSFATKKEAHKYLYEGNENHVFVPKSSQEEYDGTYYAVKEGFIPGIYLTEEECIEQTDGCPSIEYRIFHNCSEAAEWMNGTLKSAIKPSTGKPELIAYVDGSFNEETKVYGSGLIILKGKSEYVFKYHGNNPEMKVMRNVAGEIIAAQKAMEYAYDNGFKSIEIRHDYEGIAKWCTREWQARKTYTKEYRKRYEEISENVNITFKKVLAHSNNKYNDIADRLAKEACGMKTKKRRAIK